MPNLLDTLAQATPLWDGLFSNNASSQAMESLSGLSAFGNLKTTGLSEPAFSYSAGGKAVCVSGTLDVAVVATTVQVSYPGPANNYELTEFITNFLRREPSAISLRGSTTLSDDFSIFFLTHGGTTDHSYWDFAPGYSYIDAAAASGYATLSYDRLGTGNSAHPDPMQVVQMPLQVEIAHSLIQKLKGGRICGLGFQKVVGIGHSLGSALTQGLSAIHPDDFDAVVLTGHSGFQGGGGTGFAAAAQQIANTLPDRTELKHLPNGYFSLGPVPQALQFAFFFYPHFDVNIFLQEFKTRQTNALGETLTLGGLYAPAVAFNKPVQILNGQQDYFYCQGNCVSAAGDITSDALALFYPNRLVASSEAVTLPDMGHNVNLHFVFWTITSVPDDVEFHFRARNQGVIGTPKGSVGW